jgi:tetratricopeptide (TPR) repeat protein
LKAISLDTINETQLAIETLIEGTLNVKNDNTGKAEIFGTIADFYYKLNNFKQAFGSYEDGLKLDPHNTRILNNYSYYLSLRKQNLNKALEMSSLAVELEPNNSTYIDTKGWVLFQMERYEEARDVLRNAISKSGSTSAVITEHYADALFKTGNKDNALIYWNKARELGGDSEKLLKKIETKSFIP